MFKHTNEMKKLYMVERQT